MSEMLFLSAVVNSYDENTPEPFYARYLATLNQDQRYTVAASRVQTYQLDDTATKTVGSFSVQADWRMLIIKVVGEIQVESSGLDASSSAISGYTRCYGTSVFPGYLVWSTANLTAAITLRSEADGTVIEVFYATLAADA